MNNKWNKIAEGFKSLFRKVALNVLLTEETQAKVVAKLNEKIDLPFLDEADEKKLMDLIWDSIEEALREALESAADKNLPEN